MHADHLGRPEFVTMSNQQTVWKAYNYAYGRSVQKDEVGGEHFGFGVAVFGAVAGAMLYRRRPR